MLTAKKVKAFAKKEGVDLVGIASMDRFEGAPKGMDPRYIFPEAETMIVLGFRIPRGCFRGIEEGTYFSSYCAMGYAAINMVTIPMALRAVTLFLEEYGYEAVPIQPMPLGFGVSEWNGEKQNISRAVSPDRPAPDVLVHFRLAAVAAGLGEIGYSKMFLSSEFGPRQRLAVILTDASLEADPLFEGKICDRCMKCVEECSGKAISKEKTIKINLAGKELEWGKLDEFRCAVAYTGGVRETSPFLPPGADLIAELEASKDKREQFYYARRLGQLTSYQATAWETFTHNSAIEGARGCIRACMIHLEETSRIKAKFHYPFRKRKPWSL